MLTKLKLRIRAFWLRLQFEFERLKNRVISMPVQQMRDRKIWTAFRPSKEPDKHPAIFFSFADPNKRPVPCSVIY